MTASKDLQDNRPSSQHGLQSRPHSHSLSVGSYRVKRRKSSCSMAGVNIAALAAAAKDATSVPQEHAGRVRPVSSGTALGKSQVVNNPSSLEDMDEDIKPTQASGFGQKSSSALVDGPPLSALENAKAEGSKERIRRASEGTRLTRVERRRSTAGELRCEHCGKGYKHGSCLTKHLWEHRPEWNLTSKLLISKHQQVQLLEAASVLMTMNQDGPPGSENAVQGESDESSDSPPASGSSDPQEDDQSSRTSSPSQQEETTSEAKDMPYRHPIRQDSYASTLSRSYQSTSATSFAPSSGPHDGSELHYSRRPSFHRRPSTASLYESEENPEVVAAAQGLLSCSLGTPTHGPTQLPPDVPPVPPLPEKFARQASRPVSLQSMKHADVDMAGVQPYTLHGHNEEEDDGVFGRMEQ